MRSDSLQALAEIAAVGITPDLVYVDSLHTSRHVTSEIRRCHTLWPQVRLVGDDYHLPTVGWAARRCADRLARKLTDNVMAWSLQ